MQHARAGCGLLRVTEWSAKWRVRQLQTIAKLRGQRLQLHDLSASKKVRWLTVSRRDRKLPIGTIVRRTAGRSDSNAIELRSRPAACCETPESFVFDREQVRGNRDPCPAIREPHGSGDQQDRQ